ncbi:MAG: hypothetical protein RBS38_11675 [Bacteroidales bacterium]|nr:hypothetical protein [Bacteroidales bacterium]
MLLPPVATFLRSGYCALHSLGEGGLKEILKYFSWPKGSILDLGDISSARGTEMYLSLWLRIWGATGNGAFNIKIVSLN